jgi:hypothetical protein
MLSSPAHAGAETSSVRHFPPPGREVSRPEGPLERRSPPPTRLVSLARQGGHITLGLAGACTEVVSAALRGTIPSPPLRRADDPPQGAVEGPPELVSVLAGATLELGLEAGTAATRTAAAAGRAISPLLSWLTAPRIVRRPIERVMTHVIDLNERWEAGGTEREEAASAFVQTLIPKLADRLPEREHQAASDT